MRPRLLPTTCAFVGVALAQTSSVRVAGRLQSFTGEFLRSGSVSVWTGPQQLASGEIGETGDFDLSVPEVPMFQLRVAAEGHVPGIITIEGDERRREIGSIVLQPSGAGPRQPIPRYTLLAGRLSGAGPRILHVFESGKPDHARLVTDSDGRFVFPTFDGTVYELTEGTSPGKFRTIAKWIAGAGRVIDVGDIGLPLSQSPVRISPAGPPGVIAGALYAGGVLRVIHADAKEAAIAPEPEQVDVGSLTIAENAGALGWLVESDFCCTSYPIALGLTVYRPGKPVRSFHGDGRAIFEWSFFAAGRQVGYYQDFLHGVPAQHYELRDLETGRLVAQWNGEATVRAPAWVRRLEH